MELKKIFNHLKGHPASIKNILCNKCSNWNFNHKQMRTNPPDNYPKQQDNSSPPAPKHRSNAINSNFKIRSIEITYKSLRQASVFCLHNVYKKKWNKGTAYTYLKCVGFNEHFSKKKS